VRLARNWSLRYNGSAGEETTEMNYRRFGRTGWKVSEIGYGMWGLAGWTGSDDAESMASLRRAIELGCNFFDTAWAYGDGKSEQILGKIVREFQSNSSVGGPDKHLYVATKIPPKNRRWPSRRDFLLDDCYPPAYIEEYIEKSLKNLGLETIDLMQLHTWEDRWLNDERLPRAIENMKKSGKVVWLNTAVETLKNRLLNERMSRPLIREIGDDELQRYIVRKLSERRMYYEQADVMVNEESVTLEQLIQSLLEDETYSA